MKHISQMECSSSELFQFGFGFFFSPSVYSNSITCTSVGIYCKKDCDVYIWFKVLCFKTPCSLSEYMEICVLSSF